MKQNDPTAFFWTVAESLLAGEDVTRGTMMGFPCLRVRGGFFASADHRTGDLIVKLPAPRVEEMIDEGSGQAFAPAGRRFREWVAVTERDAERWTHLMHEAMAFVVGAAPDL